MKKTLRKDVHTEHCCILHGCKYGKDDECTVMRRLAPQSFVCEYCSEDGICSTSELKKIDAANTNPELNEEEKAFVREMSMLLNRNMKFGTLRLMQLLEISLNK